MSTIPHDGEAMQVNSNKIPDLLGQPSATALANARHVRLTSMPGDDLAEEDFAARVSRLLKPMTGLVSLTICIPSMARLHPSNSLPKVLDILQDALNLHPQCRLGLVVHEAEQAWSALPLLNRIIELRLALVSIEFSRAYFPVAAMLQVARACRLESLSIRDTQVSTSSSAPVTEKESSSITMLTHLSADADPEASPGLRSLLHAAADKLTHLDLSSSSGDGAVTLRTPEFSRLARLILHEDLLPEIIDVRMPALQELVFPALTRSRTCDMISSILQSPSLPQLQCTRVSRVLAGDVSEALVQLGEKHQASITITIEELAIRDPAGLTPAALAMAENLVNAGPPIDGEWPLVGFAERTYPRLKSIVLKVHQGRNHEEFIASLNAPNLDSSPKVSLIGKKKGKAGRG